MKIRMSTLRRIIRECAGDDMPQKSMGGRDLDYQVPSEGKHAKGHLFHTSQDAMRLHDILMDEDNIPTWCLEYLAIARHGVGVVHDYLSYKISNKK